MHRIVYEVQVSRDNASTFIAEIEPRSVFIATTFAHSRAIPVVIAMTFPASAYQTMVNRPGQICPQQQPQVLHAVHVHT